MSIAAHTQKPSIQKYLVRERQEHVTISKTLRIESVGWSFRRQRKLSYVGRKHTQSNNQWSKRVENNIWLLS